VHKKGKPVYVRVKLSSISGILTGKFNLSLKRVRALELRQGELSKIVEVKRVNNREYYLEEVPHFI
jgi:hypothetical protein